ncbi:c-type cytochrome [Shewanella frigidimarina]|jgi:cytochrome c553|uniref:Cytochrome c, class I n=1 Tax=Shewanella frigidimarina (strain NCIMB 400) TaxID=318167 RepID=Q07W44_SHEFN|nr:MULTISPECIES: c-type cytochrome [Shewanella]ABI73770.1 cytochrome c, class I [Shewanella frigidimarina NCIMB 400]MBB1425207.1 cytochrome c4 [Shewanella sp. SG44-2]PKI07365.1 cytochrome c4 [Shewanella sp. 11B5]RPA35946.1 cytochrome c4 [Shewanella frigidimarina]RPA59738.1 cytochrome c4 [Shewanella frigidimarina]|tara:strand:- start:6371 stop:6994 length:624 start_codon:yes stop_codon:yes gene_type:complete
MKKLALALSVVAAMSSPVMAEGNAEVGKTKAIVCSACHGVDGNSMIDMYPKLAGQHPAYLEKQLTEFRLAAKTGGAEGRMDPIMIGMSMGLSDEDIADISAFFASQVKVVADVADVPAAGEKLYKGGDAARGITACVACHGPEGEGAEAAGFPAVGGQHANYIKIQLTKFRDASRHNDLNGMMQDVAKKLSDADIDALSKYISSIKN